MGFLRRLFAKPPERGTLTLLDGSAIVFGFPPDYTPSEAEITKVMADIRAWLDDNHLPLVLPFPVEVTDHRGKVYGRIK